MHNDRRCSVHFHQTSQRTVVNASCCGVSHNTPTATWSAHCMARSVWWTSLNFIPHFRADIWGQEISRQQTRLIGLISSISEESLYASVREVKNKRLVSRRGSRQSVTMCRIYGTSQADILL